MSGVAEKIAKEIEERGAIPFARFMELALYCPVYGYYEKEEDTIGRRGDYYTSVSIGSLFGELLGFQFAAWLPPGEPAEIVEAGAHGGALAQDILGWIREWRPELFSRLTYRIVEPSERRRIWQEKRLDGFAGKVCWAGGLGELRETAGARRIIFANELLDAFPVHRMRWDANTHTWFEWGVTVQEGRFAWERLPRMTPALSCGALPELSPQLASLLPDGFTWEVCPAAEAWWRSAAGALGRGRLVAMDYALTADELLRPERTQGTLRGYRRHQLAGDVLAHPGEQDITAHVNFSALQAAGEAAGLQTEGTLTQEQFLTRIAERVWEPGGSFPEWTAQRTRQFQTLTHPDHLGRAFRVVVQVTRDG